MVELSRVKKLNYGEEALVKVHGRIFELPKEPNLNFLVVHASKSRYNQFGESYLLGTFAYEIYEGETLVGEHSQGGTSIIDTEELTLGIIRKTYKERLYSKNLV